MNAKHKLTAGEALLGVGVAGAAAALFYFLFKPGGPAAKPIIPSSITDWNPFSPSVPSPAPVSLPQSSGAMVLPEMDFTTPSFSQGHVDVISPVTGKSLLRQPNGADCTTSGQCASGVCVNGSCVDASEWS